MADPLSIKLFTDCETGKANGDGVEMAKHQNKSEHENRVYSSSNQLPEEIQLEPLLSGMTAATAGAMRFSMSETGSINAVLVVVSLLLLMMVAATALLEAPLWME